MTTGTRNAASLSEGQLRAIVRPVFAAAKDPRRIGVRHPGTWIGPATLELAGLPFAVVACESPLAFREQMARSTDERLILVTPCESADLGADVLARLERRKLLVAHRHELLRDLFRAQQVDPRVSDAAWLVNALVRHAPAEGYEVSPTGVLDLERALGTLLKSVLGFSSGSPDLMSLLLWSRSASGVERFVSAEEDLRAGVSQHLEAQLGRAVVFVLALARNRRPHDALPLGLLAGLGIDEGAEADPSVAKFFGKLEHLVGAGEIAPDAAKAWAAASRRAHDELADRPRLDRGLEDAGRVRARAQQILVDELHAGALAHRSDILDVGLTARLEQVAATLARALASPKKPSAIDEVAGSVLRHRRIAERRGATLEMAVRLVRYLATSENLPESFELAAAAYVRDGSYVDRARSQVALGDPHPALGRAYEQLVTLVTERRERENAAFAKALAHWSRGPVSSTSKVVPIEDVLQRVVAKVAEAHPVLLLVMDGMSLAVHRELAEGLLAEKWIEVLPPGCDEPVVAAAVLPTLTTVSRASLLTGTLGRGDQTAEKKGFAASGIGRAESGKPPILFHKDEILRPGTKSLSEKLVAELEEPKRRLVGVVINSVDDWLAKDTQIETVWSPATIEPLSVLLPVARQQGRRIVITSDHGHVLDRAMERREAVTDTSRARPVGAPVDPSHEVEVEGPRVVGPGQRMVLIRSEALRYVTKGARGHHGGATPQEVLVPVAVFAGEAADSERDAPDPHPDWWQKKDEVALEPPKPGELFSEPKVAPHEDPRWIKDLVKSRLYKNRRELYARRVPRTDDIVIATLRALAAHDDRLTRPALAKAIEVSPLRLGSHLTSIRVLLNDDGQEVLTFDDDEVKLDRKKLERIFLS